MFERCIYFNSNALVRNLNRVWDAAFQNSGLSASHAYLLRMVYHQPGLVQKEIARQLHLEKSTVTRFVNVLLNKKLIVRRSGEDGRENFLYPTKEGKQLAKNLDVTGSELFEKMRTKVTAKQFDSLVKDMRQVLSKLD